MCVETRFLFDKYIVIQYDKSQRSQWGGNNKK